MHIHFLANILTILAAFIYRQEPIWIKPRYSGIDKCSQTNAHALYLKDANIATSRDEIASNHQDTSTEKDVQLVDGLPVEIKPDSAPDAQTQKQQAENSNKTSSGEIHRVSDQLIS